MRRCLLVTAAVCALLTGCSAETSSTPSSTSAPAPSLPTGTPPASARPDVITESDLGSAKNVVWREDIDYENVKVTNEDLTTTAGAYQLQAVCSAGRVKISADRTSEKTIDCTGALGPGLDICTTKTGLLVSVERLGGPLGDLAWQLKKVDAQRCTK